MAPTDTIRFVSASSIDLLYDDSNDDSDVFTFSQSTNRGWTVFPDLQWQGGSATVLSGEGTAGSDDEEGELLTVRYRGSGFSLYGLAPSAAEAQRFRVSVNEQKPVEATFGGTWSSSSSASSSSTSLIPSSSSSSSSNSTASLSYGMWYNIETLDTSTNRAMTIVKFYDLPPGLSVDYAKIIANPGSPTISVPVMVDDTDSQIIYSSSWMQTQEPFTLPGKSQVAAASAYGGGVHVGRQVGDTVQLDFLGNAIKVFGLILPGGSSGEGMTVSYTVDSMPPQVMRYGSSFAGSPSSPSSSSSTTSTGDSPLGLGMVAMQNYELFSSGTIQGDVYHSLLINITSIHSSSSETQQALVIDYFTYEPLKRDVEQLAKFASGMAYDTKKTTPKLIWVLTAVFVGLGVVLVIGSCLRIFMKRRPDVVRRLAQTVRLDLEFSFNNTRKFLRSTILDIRPQTPPPAPPGASQTDNNSSQPSSSSSPSAPGSSSDQNQNPSQERQAQVQELWSIIAYLSRINVRLMSAVGRSNNTGTSAQGSGSSRSGWGLGSFGIQSQGRRPSAWGSRSRSGVDEPPPPYRV